jgi:Protein of unknown function (DUF3606)
MNDEQEVRYWTEALGCSKDELAAALARVGNSIDAVRREVYRHWAYGTFRQGDPRKQYRDGDEEDRASEGESLSSAPPNGSGSLLQLSGLPGASASDQSVVEFS